MSFEPAARTRAVQPSAVLEMIRRAREMEASGREVAFLVQGEPDFDTPAHIVEAAHRAMLDGYTHYPPAEGYLDLRTAIAERVRTRTGVDYDPAREILVTNGAALGLYLAVAALVEPGDEVLIPDPAFGSYAMIVESAGGVVVRVPYAPDGDRLRLDPDAYEAAVTPRTKAVILCSPDNPTGHVPARDSLAALADVAERHDLIVIADEVYDELVYDDAAHVSFPAASPAAKARTILVQSFSKTYAMTGWRVGYNAAPPEIMKAMVAMNAVAGRAAAAFTQRAALAAITGPQDDVERMRASYARRRTRMLDGLADVPGLRSLVPDGAFYVFVDARALGRPDDRLALDLLEHGGVVTTPGDYYGPAGRGHLRLSFASSDATIDAGLAGLARAAEAIRSGS